jgi:sulfide:quinone oxidoreductase
MRHSQTLNVLIVGGGSAALEAAFRLQHVAENRVNTTILAPDDQFVTHAMAVLVPFAAGDIPHESLDQMALDAGARLHRGRMVSVDTDAHQVLTANGEAIDYDVLLIAVGAVQRTASPHVLAFGGPGTEERMHGLVQDLEAGFVRRIAFVVPTGATWPLPLYELALMSAERAYEMNLDPELTLVTVEDAPLGLFGAEASGALAARLVKSRIAVHTGVHAEVPRAGVVQLQPSGERLHVDRVVSLPILDGPAVQGLPHDARGFLPVDRHGRVQGAPDVYAAGDATHHAVKQGGLACQQADAAAEAIAARAGAEIEPEPYVAMLQGVLLTERAATNLRRETSAGSVVPDQAVWWPPTKIAGRELSRHLGSRSRHTSVAQSERLEVRRPVAGRERCAPRSRSVGQRETQPDDRQ